MSATNRGRRATGTARTTCLPLVLLTAITVLVGCDAGAGAKPGQPSASPSASPTPSSGGLGGTLHVVAANDVPALDSADADSPQAAFLLRLTTRQLYTWSVSQFPQAASASGPAGPPSRSASPPVSPGPTETPARTPAPTQAPTKAPTEPLRPVPDLADRMPSITDGGRTYTITLRGGAQWDVPGGGRQVTAPDVVRGIKRLCNPVHPSPLLPYFTSTIVGMRQFCAKFAGVAKTPKAIGAFVESTNLPGVHADNDMTVSFHLISPARDFLSLLALPAASPVPTEMLNYLPDSAAYRRNVVSDGPYRITEYQPGRRLLLRRNTQWVPSSDPARTAYVDGVQIDFGVPPAQQQQQVLAGTADIALDAADAAAAAGAKPDGSGVAVVDRGTTAELVLNTRRSTAGAAQGQLTRSAVRAALQTCFDARTIVRALGGPALASASHQVLVPGTWGYRPQNIYGAGRPDSRSRCETALAAAGVPHLPLTYLALGRGRDPEVVAAITEALARAGVSLQVADARSADLAVLQDGHTRWDVALVLITPDWPGDNARAYIQPHLVAGAAENYGGYANPAIDTALQRAAAAGDDNTEAARWAALDAAIMRDAPFVPIAHLREVVSRSDHVGGWRFLPTLNNADPTQIFLPVRQPRAPSPPPAGTSLLQP